MRAHELRRCRRRKERDGAVGQSSTVCLQRERGEESNQSRKSLLVDWRGSKNNADVHGIITIGISKEAGAPGARQTLWIRTNVVHASLT